MILAANAKRAALLAAVLVAACGPSGAKRAGTAARGGLTRAWPATGIKRVLLRAGFAPEATVAVREGDTIEVSGQPSGGAAGYHSPDPNWKETSAADWGLDFVAETHGDLLVVSSKNEIAYIHHAYTLRDVTLAVPPGVEVTRERRALSGNGAPDLLPPSAEALRPQP